MLPKQQSLKQTGDGYQLCPSIKTTPKAKGSNDKGAQMMAIRCSNNPEYVPLPKVNFIEGGILTGWEDVTPDEVLHYNLTSNGYNLTIASNASCSPSPPGTPTPSGLSHTAVLGGESNLTISNSSDDGWGWELDINNGKVIVNKGCHTNSIHENINYGFQEI
ncbi:hypothetical protein H0H87_006206 [Tephrocybe sp. NHM501043]|nr:hypothetical protein H0H87_006206 [Tephrocybe sp. NHM501043]